MGVLLLLCIVIEKIAAVVGGVGKVDNRRVASAARDPAAGRL
jgi:hypothetical protein